MSTTTFLSVRWDEPCGQYYAELFVQSVCKDDKWLTGDESEALGSYLNYSEDWVTIPVAEILEQIDSGDILLDDESNLKLMLEEVKL